MKRIWEKIERYIYYVGIGIVLLLNLLTYFVPIVGKYFDYRAMFIVFCLVFILLFKDIDEHIIKQKNMSVTDNFDEGILAAIAKCGTTIQNLDILAVTSLTYCHAMKSSCKRIKIKRLRLLVYKPKPVEKVELNRNIGELSKFERNRDVAIAEWHSLHEQGLIESLEIHYYSFAPTFHFAIFNEKHTYSGLYHLHTTEHGYKLFNLFNTFSASNEICATLLSDYKGFFEEVYNEFSEEVTSSSKVKNAIEVGGVL